MAVEVAYDEVAASLSHAQTTSTLLYFPHITSDIISIVCCQSGTQGKEINAISAMS